MVTYYENLADKVLAIYPQLTQADFFYIRLRNDSDGKGDYIEKWDHPTLPRPTDAQLEAQ
ncbi:Bacteriophage SP-beta, YorD [uncultured Caudovirales phage]|uniref:Bacteriophage SP-beta, YorD n=1 Tax=uncultured Caudovirales phage TaxID=2100421 RepID=A0A6J5NN87_9CAUD|nr:Bacteriophage SP-beta, YorD [uncultured Caudovirales phage]